MKKNEIDVVNEDGLNNQVVVNNEQCGGSLENMAGTQFEQNNDVTEIEMLQSTNNSSNVDDNEICDGQQEKKHKISKFERKRRVKKICKISVSIVCWILSAFVLFLCVNNLYQQVCNQDSHTGLFGIGTAVVASDSMDSPDSEPRIQKNDLVFYIQPDIDNIKSHDIVIYKTETPSETKLIIHRVEEIREDGTFVAKGDNNSVADDPAPISSIVGKYAFKINDIGVLFNWLSTKFAPVWILLIILIIFVIRVTLYYFNKKKVVAKITTKEENRNAINYFFDI